MTDASPDRADTSDHLEASALNSTLSNFDDSRSDISMSDTTEDDEHEVPPIISSVGSRKRRHTADEESNGHNGEISLKRLKPDQALLGQYASNGHLHQDRSLLPTEIWHNIFVFTPPRTLASLLQVNKLFNSYLDPSSNVNIPVIERLSTSVAKSLDPDSIWQASRALFRPGMPTPLAGFSELDMWKLACQKKCQFCHTKAPHENTLTDQWHSGPGEKGVRVIWSFGFRSCASCLLKNSMKEVDLLLSSSDPSIITPALPFVFLTNDNHMVSHASLQASLQSGLPSQMQVTKYFYKAHIADMKLEFFKAKEMGAAAAEEWIKGLDDLGKDRRNDAIRWERWEATGGVQRMHAIEPHEKVPTRLPNKPQTPAWAVQPVAMPAPFGANLAQQNKRPSSAGKVVPQAILIPQPIMAPISSNAPRFNSPAANGSGFPPRQRTKEEAAEMKAARKAEIERRAASLDPPLSTAVLAHMSSFQAALQIIKPLDDNAWELLKPRLLSQRAEAEQREKDRIMQTRVLQEAFDGRRHLPHDQEAKEAEKEWDDVQAPLRARIGGFADEIIRDGWANGAKVTNSNSPQFAAEVLVYVRKRFYAEISKDDAAARATGQQPKVDPPHGPYTRKLILENMKWVFDTKIKPHTEQYRKELFVCNGCDNNSKYYGFEGVIQHYAAKHTNSLSVGSVVVHWKAEWPEFPPFHPDPTQSKGPSYALPTSSYGNNGGPPAHSNYGWTGYPPTSAPMPIQSANPQAYQQNSSFGQQNYGEPYAASQNGFQNPSQGLQGSQYPGNGQSYQSYQPLSADQTGTKNGYPHPAGNFVPPPVTADPRIPGTYGNNGFPQSQPNPAAQNSGYRAQLEFVAATAREIWNSTTGIKEMPGSVRVYVIIHHVINRSRGQFPSEPPLAMFIDGLSNNKDMRPVRNVNGLVCKTCNSDPSRAVPDEKKSFSLPQLFNHFQAHHVPSQPQIMASDLYWVNDMVQLPEMSKVSALLYTPGMDDYKLKLIADIFPMAFPSPLPRVEAARAAVAQSESFHRNNKLGDRSKNGKDRHGNGALSKQNRYSTAPAPDNSAFNYGNSGQVPYDTRNESLPGMRSEKNDTYIPQTAQDSAYGEPTHVYDGLPYQGNAAYDPRAVDHYAHDQRPDGAQQQHSVFASASSNRQPTKSHTATISSEDGVSRTQSKHPRNRQPSLAGRIDLPPGENVDKVAKEAEEQERLQEEALRASWKAERMDSMRRTYKPSSEHQPEGGYSDGGDFDTEDKAIGTMRPHSPERMSNNRGSQPVQERITNQLRPEVTYDYGDRAGYATQGASYTRERSPELVDHRYKRNNVVYREESQPIHGSGRGLAPRYSRYESVRLENDRARSRSPVYVKVGAQAAQYRERSPVLQSAQPEPIYRGPSPPGNTQQMAYDRAPRTEYYYADEPRARQPPPPDYLEKPHDFIKVDDPEGPYMIRRLPAHRREPVYAQYEEEPYARQPGYDSRDPAYDSRQPVYEAREPVYESRASVYEAREPVYAAREPIYEAREPVYETRAPVSRTDPAYYEEYDPRNPAPPPTTLRQSRYQ